MLQSLASGVAVVASCEYQSRQFARECCKIDGYEKHGASVSYLIMVADDSAASSSNKIKSVVTTIFARLRVMRASE